MKFRLTKGAVSSASPTVDTSHTYRLPAASLRKNSIALFAADLANLVLSLCLAVITARVLGPALKGYYASLMLLAGLLMNCSSVGLGEAAIVSVGQGRVSLQGAVASTIQALLPLAAAGSVVCLVAGHLVLRPSGVNQRAALIIAAVLVAAMTGYNVIVSFLMADERLVAYALLSVALSAVSAAAVWVLLIPGELDVAGAALGNLVGAATVLATTIFLVRRANISLRPRGVPGYLSSALRLGAAMQFSSVLVLLAARLDLLLVYRISGSVTAGAYSVALTIGALVTSVPIALAHAAFPRLARLAHEEAAALTARTFRLGMAAAFLGAVGLALASPVVTPLLFGDPYRPAVVPALLLVPSGLFWSAQWLLSRAAAARGAPGALVLSFTLSFFLMLALDLVLIPPLGATGAGAAALASSAAGAVAAAIACRGRGWSWRELVPRRADVRDLVTVIRHVAGSRAQQA